MIEYQNLTLIGTSHISRESVSLVQRLVQEKQPAFVAVELDRGRFHALMEKEPRRLRLKDLRRLGVGGFLFAMFGVWIEEKLGKMVGSKPGSEMKVAIYEAAKIHAKVLLIDQDIQVTLRRLFKQLTWREKGRFVFDIFKGIFGIGERIQFDLRAVPPEELIEKLLVQVKERYPSFYRVLIEERNVFMAKRLQLVMKKSPESKIVAVVGAGHEKGILEILQKPISSSSA